MAVVALWALAVPSAPTALANHPAGSCLDLTDTGGNPEQHVNPTGTSHTITATVKTIVGGDGTPANPGTCTGPSPAFTGGTVSIDFEVTGPGDPQNDGDSPETPDLTCSVGTALGPSCSVSYTGTQASRTASGTPGQEAGPDVIRGWIDHDAQNPSQGGVVEADRAEGRDEAATPGTGCPLADPTGVPEPDCTDVVEKRWTASRLDCEPESASNQTGEEHTITCTSRDEEGNPVAGTEVDGESTGANDAEQAGPDYSCTTGADGECEFTHTGNSAGTTTYRFWIDDDGDDTNTTEGDQTEGPGDDDTDDTDVVTKSWTASRLDCTPETRSNRSGETHSITCTATDETGQGVEGTKIDAESTGANDPDSGNNPPPDYTCTTDTSGSCTLQPTHTGTQTGTTTYRAWIDDDGDDNNVNEGDTSEAQCAAASETDPPCTVPSGGAGSTAEPDDTDVVTKTWTAAAGVTIDCDDESGDDRESNPGGGGEDSNETYLCTVRDVSGNLARNELVRGEVRGPPPDDTGTGVNDPDNPDASSYDSPDYSCTTRQNVANTPANEEGTCEIVVEQADDELGTTEICFWLGSTTDGETFCDEENEPTDEPEGNDAADQVEKTWFQATPPSASRLDCTPETDSNPAGSSHTITCTVSTAAGARVGNTEVDAEATGANDPDGTNSNTQTTPDFTCVTAPQDDPNQPGDQTGTCQFTHGPQGPNARGTTPAAGTTTYRAWIDFDNDNARSEADTVEGRCAGGGGDEQGCSPPMPGTGCVTPPVTGEPDCTDVVEKTWGASRLECTPENDANRTGETHRVTCTARDENGNPVSGGRVHAEATGAGDPDDGDSPESPDFTCTPRSNDPTTGADETGTCEFTHTSNEGGTTTYRAWMDDDNNAATPDRDAGEGADSGDAPDEPAGTNTPGDEAEPDDTDVVTKRWTASRLDCTPETDTNPPGRPHTITCSATDAEGNGVGGTRIQGEATGAGDPDNGDNPPPDFTCTTAEQDDPATQNDETETCQFTHTSDDNGQTTYRFWIDDDQNDQDFDGDQTEAQCAAANETSPSCTVPSGGAGGTAEPDDTDVVTKTWAITLDCEPETDTNAPGQQHTIICTVGSPDESGSGMSGTRIQGEANGAGDEDDDTPPPDFSCTTAPQDDPSTPNDERNSCRFTHTSNESGQTTYRFWVDNDQNDQDFDGDQSEAQCAAANETSPSCTVPSGGAGGTAEPDRTDVVTKTWAAALDCRPESDSNPTGQPHTITCTVSATDDPDTRVGGTKVDAEATGAGDPDGGNEPPPDFTCTTASQDDPNQQGDQTGTCSFTHTSPESGETTYRAWIDDDGDEENVDEGDESETPGQTDTDDTDVVTKTWTASRLNCEPETATNRSGETHRITCTTTDEQGNRAGGTRVDAEATGAGDPDDGDTPPPDFTCTTAPQDDPDQPGDQTGTCSFEHTTDEAGQTTYRAWIDDDEDADNVNEGDVDEAPGEDDNDDTDVVTKTWAATRLDCEPETATNPAGTSHTITCTARDEGGRPAGGQVVAAEANGANDADNESPPADFTCTTASQDDPNRQGDQTGTCSFTHQGGNEAGTTTYRAWIDEDGDPDTSEADAGEDRCAASSEGCTPPNGGAGDVAEPDNTDVVAKTWTALVDCRPESDTNPTGSQHEVTCRASSSNGQGIQGVNVDAEATGDNDPDDANSPQSPDFTCTTGGNGECTFTHGSGGQSTASAGQTTYRAWADDDGNGSFDGDGAEGPSEEDQDDTDVVTKTWVGPGLDCFPEQDTNPTGTSHQITCTVRDASTQPLPNRNVDVEATGANDPDNGNSQNTPDFTCTTGQDGSCTVTHSGNTNSVGTTLYRAWVDAGDPGSSEADQSETREQSDNDETDVVEKRWGAGRLDCTPETESNPAGTSHQVTCTARDGNNQPVPNANVDAEATGANDPDGGNSLQSPDFTCTTGQGGSCTFTHGGPGGGGSTSGAGTTTYRAWVDVDGNDATPDDVDQTEQRDEAGNGAGGTNEPDHTDVVQKTWTAGVLDCTPETDQNPVGTAHVVACTARDASGNAVPGTEVDVEITGANDRDNNNDLTSPDFSCTTSSTGSCSFTHGGGGSNGTSDAPGTSTYRAWIDADSANGTAEADATETRDESGTGAGGTAEPDATDVVEKLWATGPRAISCTPASATNPTGTDHTVTCTVRDRSGQTLSGAAVTFTTSGVGTLRSQAQQTSNSAGQVQATTTSSEEGAQTITATLNDDLQGNEPNDADECDRAQGDPTGAPAGQCSASVSKTWIEPVAVPANLTLTPAEATNDVGTNHILTATVTDEDDAPVQGAPVTWTSTGVGTIEESDATTDANGIAVAVITSEETGDQQVTATTSPCAAGGDCDDTAVKHWTAGRCTIEGTDDGDTLIGTNGDDVICAGDGNDTIDGRGGDDVIIGGDGRDRIDGGSGRDAITGGSGGDVIVGGAGRDEVSGGGGDDALRGMGGDDRLFGLGGDDRLAGGTGEDRLRGGRGDDRLDGGRDRDSCAGGGGRNTLRRCER